jgi:hypothetical protein
VYPVPQISHAEVFKETEKSAHASSTLNSSAALSLQGPCAIKMDSDREDCPNLTEKTPSLGCLGTPLLGKFS